MRSRWPHPGPGILLSLEGTPHVKAFLAMKTHLRTFLEVKPSSATLRKREVLPKRVESDPVIRRHTGAQTFSAADRQCVQHLSVRHDLFRFFFFFNFAVTFFSMFNGKWIATAFND